MHHPTLIRRLAPILLLAAFVLALWTASHHAFQNLAQPPGTLQEPTRALDPSQDNLGSVIALANRGQPPLFHRELGVPRPDVHAFLKHLATAAPQRGWFMHNGTHHDAVIIMPAEELTELEDLTRDPINWVTRENQRITPAQGPNTLNLVTVGLRVHQEGAAAHRLWRFLGILGFIVSAVLTAFVLLVIADQLLDRRRHSRQPSPNPTGATPHRPDPMWEQWLARKKSPQPIQQANPKPALNQQGPPP